MRCAPPHARTRATTTLKRRAVMKDRTVLAGAGALAALLVTSGLAFGAGGGAFGNAHTYVAAVPLSTSELDAAQPYIAAQPAPQAVLIPPSPTWRIAPVTSQRPKPTYDIVDADRDALSATPSAPTPPPVQPVTVPIPPPSPEPVSAPIAVDPRSLPTPDPVEAAPEDVRRALPPADQEVAETLRPVITIPPITTRPR